MQNDRKNGIAFGSERKEISNEVKCWYLDMLKANEEKRKKIQEHQEWISKYWIISGTKANYKSDSLQIEVECVIDSNGFKHIDVNVEDDDRTYTSGSYTGVEIPIEVILEISK